MGISQELIPKSEHVRTTLLWTFGGSRRGERNANQRNQSWEEGEWLGEE